MIYLVVNLRTQERGGFNTAWDVAHYMWGRDLTDYRIYKRGVAVQWLSTNFTALAVALEAEA